MFWRGMKCNLSYLRLSVICCNEPFHPYLQLSATFLFSFEKKDLIKMGPVEMIIVDYCCPKLKLSQW